MVARRWRIGITTCVAILLASLYAVNLWSQIVATSSSTRRIAPTSTDLGTAVKHKRAGTADPGTSHKPSTAGTKLQSADAVHVIFVTDCSGYQHWQSIALWYSARSVRQNGPVTRIACGCDNAQQNTIRKQWALIDTTSQFRVHFAETLQLGRNYKYSNKPSGLHHWLQHARIEELYVALIDPDMLLLQPITVTLAAGLHPSSRTGKAGKNQFELADADGIGRVLATSIDGLPDRVSKGHPAGQHFGLGGTWARAGTPSARKNFLKFSESEVCGLNAPCTRTDFKKQTQSTL